MPWRLYKGDKIPPTAWAKNCFFQIKTVHYKKSATHTSTINISNILNCGKNYLRHIFCTQKKHLNVSGITQCPKIRQNIKINRTQQHTGPQKTPQPHQKAQTHRPAPDTTVPGPCAKQTPPPSFLPHHCFYVPS